MMEIPLVGGAVNAHQTFSVQLGENFITFALTYISSGQWACDMSRAGAVIIAGAMLEVGADIIRSWNLTDDIGQIVLSGDDTTLDNLGVDNTLVWIAPNESL